MTNDGNDTITKKDYVTIMVVIECPHCEEDLEMDNDAYGLFECPYCGNEYEWGEKPKSKVSRSTNLSKLKKKSKISKPTVDTAAKESVMLVESNHILMTMFTILMMTIILAGLNSDFWYKESWEDENYDVNAEVEIGYSFSTRTMISTSTYEDVETTNIRSGYYSEAIEYLEEQIEDSRDFCSDWDLNDTECDEMIGEEQDALDQYQSLNTAGTILWIFLMLGLICSVAIILLNFCAILDDYQTMQLPDNIYQNYSKINNILTLTLPLLLITGCLLYWLIIPDFESFYDEIPGNYSAWPGMIWWVTVFISIGYIIKPAITSSKKLLQ